MVEARATIWERSVSCTKNSRDVIKRKNSSFITQLAFLTTMVGPKVAAAAAQRALETLAEEDEAALADAKAEGDEAAIKSEAGAQDAIMKDEQGEELETALVPADRPLPATRLRAAAATALAAAAAKAKLLADAEEREMQRLVLAAVDVQCKKINLKLQVRGKGGGPMDWTLHVSGLAVSPQEYDFIHS